MVFLDYKTVAFSGNGTKYVTEYKSLIVAEFSNINYSTPFTSGTVELYFNRSGQRQNFHKYLKSGSFTAFGGSVTNWIYENFSASHVIPAGVSIVASGYSTLTGIFHIYRLPE